MLRCRQLGVTGLLSASCLLLTGCAEAPFGLARLNPMLTEEWSRDEQFGPTLHSKVEELRALERVALTMPPHEQQQLSSELARLLETESSPVLLRQLALTLAVFPTEESLAGLRVASEHGDTDVRVSACEAWHRKGGTAAVDGLIARLVNDTELDVRIAAARQLGRFNDERAIAALGDALQDPNPALQYRCIQSLREITGQNLGDDARTWQQYVTSGQAHPAPPTTWSDWFGIGSP